MTDSDHVMATTLTTAPWQHALPQRRALLTQPPCAGCKSLMYLLLHIKMLSKCIGVPHEMIGKIHMLFVSQHVHPLKQREVGDIWQQVEIHLNILPAVNTQHPSHSTDVTELVTCCKVVPVCDIAVTVVIFQPCPFVCAWGKLMGEARPSAAAAGVPSPGRGGGRSGREEQGWGTFASGGSCVDF